MSKSANIRKMALVSVFILISYGLIIKFASTHIHQDSKQPQPSHGKHLRQWRSFFGDGSWQAFRRPDQLFQYLDQPTFPCDRHIVLGGVRLHSSFLNGDKWMCLDGGLFESPCTALSFGINHEWSFEDAISALECNVFAFDPTMGVDDHNRSHNIHFTNLGLSNATEEVVIDNVTCKVDRYENIVRRLNLLNKSITYLKMDIEGFEMNFFDDVLSTNPSLLKNVNQIAMEIHPLTYKVGKGRVRGNRRFRDYWEHFQTLERLGFRLANVDINRNPKAKYMWKGKERSLWYELVWINQH